MAEQDPQPKRRDRPSFIWPIILITVGIVFLFSNLGLVEGDFWNVVWRWWPMLLVAIGLDSLFRRNEIAGPVFLIGLGLVILFSNFGLMGWGTWTTLWRFWPVLLVAIGLEIIIGRRSLWVSILVVTVIVAAIGGVLWFLDTDTPKGNLLESEVVNQPLNEISRAKIEVNPALGALNIDSVLDSTALINGEVNVAGGSSVFSDLEIQGDRATYIIESRQFSGLPIVGSWNWDLDITEQIPIQLLVSMGAGDIELDLGDLMLTGVEVSQGVGDLTLILPGGASYDAEIEQAIGMITIRLPQSTGIRLEFDKALTSLDLPNEFIQQGDSYYSPAYESQPYQVNILISQAIGAIEIRD